MLKSCFYVMAFIISFSYCNSYEKVKPKLNLIKLKGKETYLINNTKQTLTLYLLPTPNDPTDFHAETLEIKPGQIYILKDISHIQIESSYQKKINYEIIKIQKLKHYELFLNKTQGYYDLREISS